jgi:SNW domain-containing protein 1
MNSFVVYLKGSQGWLTATMSTTSTASSLRLPPPRNVSSTVAAAGKKPAKKTASSAAAGTATAPPHGSSSTNIPSYEERCAVAAAAARQEPVTLFVPRRLEDFGPDGGAFPEIHVAQYPRHMGHPQHQLANKQRRQSNALVNVQVDKEGKVSYDAIVKNGTNADKIVYSKLSDMKESDADDVALPSEQEEREEAARTEAALGFLLQKKTAFDKPSGSAMIQAATSQNIQAKTKFLNYSANPEAPGYNPAAAKRVIQMVPAQVDPMEPPKHEHFKAPRGPAEDPVPVLQAPPAKLSKEERTAWNVPACISNWKNSRGYTIPLDKRLAADGRGLMEPTVNSSNFAALAESLYVAEQQARKEVRLRAVTQKKLALAESEEREMELRKIAQQARLERGGIPVSHQDHGDAAGGTVATATEQQRVSSISRAAPIDARGVPVVEDASSVNSDEESDDASAARQREKLRIERKRERERELRLEKNMEAIKKQRLEEERDVSEKIALGTVTGTGGGDQVDSRLYNTSEGMDSGFGREDDYTAYTKPLFDRAQADSIYRPTRGEVDADEQYEQLKAGATSKFRPHKGFNGAEGGMAAEPRTAPVQFEKSTKK